MVMIIDKSRSDVVAPAGFALRSRACRHAKEVLLGLLSAAALVSVSLPNVARAVERPRSEPTMEERVQALIPDLEAHIARGMKGFDVPGLGNPEVDHVADKLKAARTGFDAAARLFAKPARPWPFPPLAPLAGSFVNHSIGKAAVTLDGDALVMEFPATGAKLKLEPWDGEIFTAALAPRGRFAAVTEDLGPLPQGFVQFQMDQEAKLNLLRFSSEDGQAYDMSSSGSSRTARSRTFAGMPEVGQITRMICPVMRPSMLLA
jgi:hypothetical protein